MVRILLVDDEPQVIEGLTLSLRRHNYHLLSADSGETALKLLREEGEVDIIISDECMAGMRGTEFLTLCAIEWPNTLRMVLTGHADTDSAMRAINESRVFRFLSKPCSPNELNQAVKEALAERGLHASRVELLVAVKHQLSLENQEPLPVSAGSPLSEELNADFPGLSDQDRRIISKRELDVLEQLCKGFKAPQIAQTLFVSPHTVRNHLKSLFRKLGVHSQRALVDQVLTSKASR